MLQHLFETQVSQGVVGFAGAAAMMLGVGPATDAPVRAAPANEAVKAALVERLPKTKISAIDCGKVEGLCEIVAGESLFYVDTKARYLIIGRVYDMQARQDLTAARLLELNPDMLVGGAAKAAAADAGEDASAALRARQASVPATPTRVDLSGLSKTGAIVWGRGGPTVTVFSDFHCGYCRALAEGLRTMNVTVVERPISVLGSRDVANQVLCARNREAAVRAAYAREPIASDGRCDTRGLDENERFAREHGFTGTPVIVRSDGAVLEGYRPPAALAAWLKGSRS